jgi:hypothetical protein
MESTSKPVRVQLSPITYEALKDISIYKMVGLWSARDLVKY